MVLYECNYCGKRKQGRYTGKNFGPPLGWHVGRTAPWPQISPGEKHACSKECWKEMSKKGSLVWRRVMRGRVVRYCSGRYSHGYESVTKVIEDGDRNREDPKSDS